jgi:aldehyde:ferredoxin oxidoreductase
MLGGYAGRFLWVDLTNGKLEVEIPHDTLLRDYVGGYGIAARVLYDRMKPKVDPLGPDNIFGFSTGPLTGSPCPAGTRWGVFGKSPLTGGWGDANGSGNFGVAMKQSGFDMIFFTGAAPKPVYLFLKDGKAELRDAGALWGKDCYEIEDWVKAEYGAKAEAACIGPSGEKLSLISGVITLKGRAAGRSGLGAVMGSKKLKAVVAFMGEDLPVADPEAVKAARKKYLGDINAGVGYADFYRATGTPGATALCIDTGDSPTRNWLASTVTMPRGSDPLKFEELVKYRKSHDHCWKCPIACWGTVEMEWEGQKFVAHQPEYETGCMFGSNLWIDDQITLAKANDICNRYGLDTISAGAAVAFAFDCYDNGLITTKDTGGLFLRWGDTKVAIQLLQMIAERQGIGDLLADGVQRAAEKIGPLARPLAMHCGGQELPAHDSRFEPAMAIIYQFDATPGRHTQACQYLVAPGFKSARPNHGQNREQQKGRGIWVKEASALCHMFNATGLCLFGYLSMTYTAMPDFLTAVTGVTYTIEDLLHIGERIANLRQAFNVREGINPLQRPMPERALGRPPLPIGPTAGITVDIENLTREHLDTMGWTLDAAIPKEATLRRLGLDDVADDLWKKK